MGTMRVWPSRWRTGVPVSIRAMGVSFVREIVVPIIDGLHRRANGENHPTSKSDGSPRVCGCIARIGRTARSVCFGRAWFSLANAIRKYGIMYFVERVDLSQRASDFVSNGLRRAVCIFGFLAYAFKFHIPGDVVIGRWCIMEVRTVTFENILLRIC